MASEIAAVRVALSARVRLLLAALLLLVIAIYWITPALAGWSWAGFAENPGDAMMIGMGWRQTDVFAARVSGGGREKFGAKSGRRLTRPRAHASSLRATILDGTLVCVWTGRSKVGRSPFAYGAPAELFCARVTLSGLP